MANVTDCFCHLPLLKFHPNILYVLLLFICGYVFVFWVKLYLMKIIVKPYLGMRPLKRVDCITTSCESLFCPSPTLSRVCLLIWRSWFLQRLQNLFTMETFCLQSNLRAQKRKLDICRVYSWPEDLIF